MRESTLAERLRAVERAVTEADVPVDDLQDEAEMTRRIEDLEERIGDQARRLDDLDAAVDAVRGYVGHINHVNRDVERTANAAVAAVDRLQAASGSPPELATVEDPNAADDVGADSAPTAADPLPEELGSSPASSDRRAVGAGAGRTGGWRTLVDVVRSIL
ncbi:MAG: hypothetical protein ABEJ55_09020 [Halanaeroarchaeum sp.]